MRVGVLGPLEVRLGGELVPFGGARLRRALIRLALDPGRTVSTDALSDALWPEGGLSDRVHALHSLMSRLRKALPGSDVVHTVPGGYRLDVEPDNVDFRRFERLTREGRTALHKGWFDVAAAVLREALTLWRGDALTDAADAAFAMAAITRLDELRLTAQEDLTRAELRTGADLSRVVAELRALTTAHPDRERARALLLRALQAEGRPAEALASYVEFRSSLAERFGADPSAELREAHLAVLRADKVGRGGNLRTPLTSFVGREDERGLVAKKLTESRLVTLTGPGGVGKTRLATTVAEDVSARFPGGVWLVELAPVTDPGAVTRTVLGALGNRGTGIDDTHREDIDRLLHTLSAAPALLVLDNCEHLLDAVAALSGELLGACPSLRLLATGREQLGITGETLVRVAPLPVTHPGPAVRLFADRAAAASPDFALTQDNAATVAEICRRLDGLPLAIELACARTRSLPVEELLTLLDDRFRVLVGGSRIALPRHRTLRAVVSWSWELLDDDERAAAEALAVFGGTITLDAAESVCPEGVPVWETLSNLVDKSLIQVAGGARYLMLETIREYALERTADAVRARIAHARYFLDLAEQAAPHLRSPAQLEWIPRLTEDRANLLGALQFACGARDSDTALRLATALAYYLTLQGDHGEAARLLRRALELPGETTSKVRSPATSGYLLNVALSGGTVSDVEGFREVGRCGHPSSAVIEPLLAALSGETEAGLAAVDRQQPHPAPLARAVLWLVRSLLNSGRGDLRESCRDLTAAAAEFRALGERWGQVTSLTYLGITRTALGEPEAAIAALEASLGPARELGNDHYQRIWLAKLRENVDTFPAKPLLG